MAENDEERLRKLEEQERRIRARKNQIKARMAKRERARRTHGLVELGAGIETELTGLTFEAFTGDRDEVRESRDRLRRALALTITLSDGKRRTVAQLLDEAWNRACTPTEDHSAHRDAPERPQTPPRASQGRPASYPPSTSRERHADGQGGRPGTGR